MLSLDSDSIDSIVHGLMLGEELQIPTEASMMSHIEILLALEKDPRQFNQMRFALNVELQTTNRVYCLYLLFYLYSYAIRELSSFITTQQSFEKLLTAIYSNHCNWMTKQRKAYVGRTSKMGISGVIIDVRI